MVFFHMFHKGVRCRLSVRLPLRMSVDLFLVTKRVCDLRAWNEHKSKDRERRGRESVREEGRERPMPCFNGSSLIVFKFFDYWSVQLFCFY